MHNDTKARAIPKAVKIAVAKRDSFEDWPCCLWCGLPAPPEAQYAFSCAHYIRRSQGGLGCERNILTLCPNCHARFDGNSKADEATRNKMRGLFREYLKEKYQDWNEEDLIYKKG